jgi:hypothetical protein
LAVGNGDILKCPVLIEQTPPSLDASKLFILPIFVTELKEEISCPVIVGLADERI